MSAKIVLSAVAAGLLLSACGEQDIILPGERTDVRGVAIVENQALPISLPAAVSQSNWTHRNGGPDHLITHPALPQTLAMAFRTSVGEGDSRRARITADPVVSNGVIFTMDARTRVSATGTNGAPIWSVSVKPALDGSNDASGGGLAVAQGRVFVTSGFGELTVLDAATGAELWTQDLDAPGGSAPTVFGDLVYLVSRDSRAWALDIETGRIRWQLDGTPSLGNFSGGAGVAVNSELAVFPFPSGEVLAAFRQGGLRRWSHVVAGRRPGDAMAAAISDISGDPVIDGNRVYVGNIGGRVAALDMSDGSRIWTATDGAVSPVWPVGGSVFLISDLGDLVRLDARDGSVVWRTDLPTTIEPRFGLFRSVHAHYGPVLAGGRLIVASTDGVIRQFDPVSGALIGTLDLPGGAATNPIVAGGTLYVVSKTGDLVAFR